jgi:signal transduction histidine kinase/ActR/RegA family two-component response regulator
MKAPVTRYLVHIGFWFATLLMMAVAGWALHDASSKESAAAMWIDHTQEVLKNIGEVNEDVGRTDSTQRGYLLAGTGWFLTDRDQAFARLNGNVARLANLTSDNAAQRDRISRLQAMITARRETMDESVRLRRSEGIEIAQTRSASGIGRAQTERMYGLVAEMRHEELRLLDLRTADAELHRKTGTGILIAAVLVGLIMLIPGYLGYVLQTRALKQTERKLRVMADSLPGALYQARQDPRGGTRFTFASAGLASLGGAGGALPEWDALVNAIDVRDRTGFVTAKAEATKSITPFACDYRIKQADGTLKWFHHEASVMREDGGSVLVNGYIRDVSEKRKLSDELQEAKVTADSANRAKSTFLATMSHEIRTPMNGMFGMLELLSLTRLDADQRTTLGIVRESGKSLLRIIDDILDFSKIDAGKLDIHPEATSIREVFERVQNIYSGNASSKGLLIRPSVDPRISPALRVDPLRLQQILNNFVSNALKFTSRGAIDLKAELIARAGGADSVRFSVTDTGIGISPENQERLFQPFSQGDGASTRRAGGTGLGLTICRRLAEMMDGSVEMVSELGKGTTMILTLALPIADAKELPQGDRQSAQGLPSVVAVARRRAPGIAQAEAEGTLVLLVDDHPTNRALLVRQVNALGYAAESAGNGVEALAKWRSGRFGVVITDCNMPEMDGYELARRIRELESRDGGKHPPERTPIISCTANALGDEWEHCLAAGMDDCLVKPVELSEILKKLDQWLPVPEAPAAPLDRAVLAGISGGDALAERGILADFRRANDADAVILERAVASSDSPEVARATHRILGASRMVGALGLAGVCEQIGHASRDSDWRSVATGMQAFHRESLRLNAYFDAL